MHGHRVCNLSVCLPRLMQATWVYHNGWVFKREHNHRIPDLKEPQGSSGPNFPCKSSLDRMAHHPAQSNLENVRDSTMVFFSLLFLWKNSSLVSYRNLPMSNLYPLPPVFSMWLFVEREFPPSLNPSYKYQNMVNKLKQRSQNSVIPLLYFRLLAYSLLGDGQQ